MGCCFKLLVVDRLGRLDPCASHESPECHGVLSCAESGVCVRSSSRVGDSDFGVNKARLAFITAELKRLGWDAKGPSA